MRFSVQPRLVLLLLLAPGTLTGQQAYRIGDPAPWIKPMHADLAVTQLEASATSSFELLLLDHQQAVGATTLERYKHIAYRLRDEGAVEDNSQVEISVDPSYEQVTLHAVALIRDGRTIDQLKPERIRVVKRESELDYHIFDGTVSLILVLEDVKPGDVIEYSYTRRGDNPVFAGHYMSTFSLQQSVPVRQSSFRLLWPSDRPLFIRRHETTVEPTITTVGARREYIWSVQDVPAKLLDDDLPEWYDAFPGVQLSDFGSWSEVAAWGNALFASPGPIPPTLQTRLASIRAANPTKEFQVLAALRYAQDEVRYLGVEIGVNSHQPFPIATVLKRGYGDCKDKAQLLVTMLLGLGIPARPALVSTTYGSHLADLQPTAAMFDHAIVRAEVDGHEYWLDPTALYQRGSLESVSAQFGVGLVLEAPGDSLVPMPWVAAAEPVTEIAVTFELGGLGKPATMRIETDYRGSAAVTNRERLRGVSPEKLQRSYTEYYAEGYPGIKSEAVPVSEDNEATNLLHTSERYTIPAFWHEAVSGKGSLGTLDPVELDRIIPSPGASGRTMPLAIDYPSHVRYTITAHLAEGWAIAPSTDSIATPAMRFVRSVEMDGKNLILRYEYETLADHVEPAATASHLEQLSRMRRLLAFSVTPPRDPDASVTGTDPREINWPIALVALFTTGLATLGAVRLSRAPPPGWPRGPVEPALPELALNGLGGWLILVGVGILIAPFKMLFEMAKTLPSYGASTWASLTTTDGVSYHYLYAPTLLLELVTNIVFVVFGILLIWLFFSRKRWFPALFVLLTITHVAVIWGDALLARAIPAVESRGGEWTSHLRDFLAGLLWVGYMFRSRRVQQTFVR